MSQLSATPERQRTKATQAADSLSLLQKELCSNNAENTLHEDVAQLQDLETQVFQPDTEINDLKQAVQEIAEDGISIAEQELLITLQAIFGDILGEIDRDGVEDLDDDDKKKRQVFVQRYGTNRALLTRIIHQTQQAIQRADESHTPFTLSALLSKLGQAANTALLTEASQELVKSSISLEQKVGYLLTIQKIAQELDEHEAQQAQALIEQIIAAMFERQSLEVYEINIDNQGRIIIKAIDPNTGEHQTLVISLTDEDSTLNIDSLTVEESQQLILADPQQQKKLQDTLLHKLISQKQQQIDPQDGGMLQFMLPPEQLQKDLPKRPTLGL